MFLLYPPRNCLDFNCLFLPLRYLPIHHRTLCCLYYKLEVNITGGGVPKPTQSSRFQGKFVPKRQGTCNLLAAIPFGRG